MPCPPDSGQGKDSSLGGVQDRGEGDIAVHPAAGEQVGGDDGHFAPVGQGDAKADGTVSYFTAALRSAFFSSRFPRQTASVRTSRTVTSARRT